MHSAFLYWFTCWMLELEVGLQERMQFSSDRVSTEILRWSNRWQPRLPTKPDLKYRTYFYQNTCRKMAPKTVSSDGFVEVSDDGVGTPFWCRLVRRCVGARRRRSEVQAELSKGQDQLPKLCGEERPLPRHHCASLRRRRTRRCIGIGSRRANGSLHNVWRNDRT